MSLFLSTFFLAVGVIALSFLGLGIGKLLKKKSLDQIKRCGHPEKKDTCPYCTSSTPQGADAAKRTKKKNDH